jgi:hypothetical protein
MIKDEEIIFITTSLHTKWLGYQSDIIRRLFPNSEHIIIDGRKNWPYVWFDWLSEIEKTKAKWFVHLDEDCFLTGRDQLTDLLDKMDSDNITISAVSDAYHHYRGSNPVAINPFFMVGNTDHFRDIKFDTSDLEFSFDGNGWRNNKGIYYNPDKHRIGFEYPHKIMENGENCSVEQEPYYMLLWMLKERGRKFNYLYPYFDDRFKSTNPRISENSDDIAIHMWYARQWNSPMDVHGIPNNERYKKIEKYLNDNFQ